MNANGGHHPEWVPPLARTEAPSGRSPRGGAQAVLTPQGCKAAGRSSARRQGTLAAPCRSRTMPRGARRVVFHEDTDRRHGGHNDIHTQRASSTTDPRRRSKRPRNEQTHIPTVPTPAERERQAALHTGPHQAADRGSSSSATSLPGSVAGRRPGGQHATDTRPREPAADERPAQGVGEQPPLHPPPRGRGAMTLVPDTGTGHPTNGARAPRGSPPQLQHGQTAGALRTHHNNRSTTRAAQERMQK